MELIKPTELAEHAVIEHGHSAVTSGIHGTEREEPEPRILFAQVSYMSAMMRSITAGIV